MSELLWALKLKRAGPTRPTRRTAFSTSFSRSDIHFVGPTDRCLLAVRLTAAWSQITSALLLTALGEWHRKVTSFCIVVLNLLLIATILKITPYDPDKYNDMNRLELWGAVETVITYMSTLVAYHIDDPSSSVAGVLWLVASGIALVCFIAAEVVLGPKEKERRERAEATAP